MPATFEQIHPVMAQQLLDQIQQQGEMAKQLYRIIYMSQVHPNDQDLSEVALVKVTLHHMASSMDKFYDIFMANVPSLYPVLFVIAIAPVSPDIPEDGFLEVTTAITGPRSLEN